MKVAILFVLLAFALTLVGCGITGETSKFRLDYNVAAAQANDVQLTLNSLTIDPDAPRNQAVMAYNFGKFSDADRINLEDSIRRTFQQFQTGDKIAVIDVYIHRYALSFSNDEIAGLVVVDWCLKSGGSIVHDELFYVASYSGESFLGLEAGTLGYRKNLMNKAIVGYITDSTLAILSDVESDSKHKLIFSNPLDALTVLPARVDSSGGTFSTGSSLVFIPGGGRQTFFEEVIAVTKIDWINDVRLIQPVAGGDATR